jgi:hypothetical protein
MNTLKIEAMNDSYVRNLGVLMSRDDQCVSCVTSLENKDLVKQGINIKVSTKVGDFSIKVRSTNYPAINSFYRVQGYSQLEDDVFKSKADYIVEFFGDNTTMIYQTKALTTRLKELFKKKSTLEGHGIDGVCLGKLITINELRAVSLPGSEFELEDLVLNPTGKKLTLPQRHRTFIESRRESKAIASRAIANVIRTGYTKKPTI